MNLEGVLCLRHKQTWSWKASVELQVRKLPKRSIKQQELMSFPSCSVHLALVMLKRQFTQSHKFIMYSPLCHSNSVWLYSVQDISKKKNVVLDSTDFHRMKKVSKYLWYSKNTSQPFIYDFIVLDNKSTSAMSDVNFYGISNIWNWLWKHCQTLWWCHCQTSTA